MLSNLLLVFKRWYFLRCEEKVYSDQWSRHLSTSCKICAYHRYGIEHGYKSPDSKPRIHHCIETEIVRISLGVVIRVLRSGVFKLADTVKKAEAGKAGGI